MHEASSQASPQSDEREVSLAAPWMLRHESGWVTAYAHNDEILVKRGDKVKRGQSIAKAGKTGTVDQPQVHFELRQGQKPIDPTPHMEKM